MIVNILKDFHELDEIDFPLLRGREMNIFDFDEDELRHLAEGWPRLTPRQLDVVERVSKGQSNKSIAVALSISPRTVEVHRSMAMLKLGAHSPVDLVRRVAAMQLRLVQPAQNKL